MGFMFFAKRQATATTVENAIALDDAKKSKQDFDKAECFRHVEKETGKKSLEVLQDFMKVKGGMSKLSIEDYFLYRLYDENISIDEKKRFISDSRHWPLVNKCIEQRAMAATEDKFFSYGILSSAGVPVPRTQAILDGSVRAYGSVPKLASADDLIAFLENDAEFPLFCKLNGGIGSHGVRIITGIDGEIIQFEQDEPMSAADFFDLTVPDKSYLLQDMVQNAPELARYSKYVATVRIMNLVKKDDISIPFASIKIPAPNNIADNYWRAGNFIANVDVATGVMNRVIRGKSIHTEEIDRHPDLDEPMLGEQLPYWDQVLDMARLCGGLFAMQTFQSLDIALTPTGPVVIEVNSGASFELPQLASGEGMLTDEVIEFFRSHECKL